MGLEKVGELHNHAYMTSKGELLVVVLVLVPLVLPVLLLSLLLLLPLLTSAPSLGVVYMAYSSLCGPCPNGGEKELLAGALTTGIGKKYIRTPAVNS